MPHTRKRIAELLQANRDGDRQSQLVDLTLVVLILLNVVAVILETVPELETRWARWFFRFEVFSVVIFTIEYLLRLWSCVDRDHGRFQHPLRGRLRWMTSPLGIVDLLAIAPFYIALFVPALGESALILRMFRGIRLLRIFKLTRYSPAFQILAQVTRREANTLGVAGFILVMILVIASWGIHILERDLQPEVFGSIPAAMWWSVVTLTTVGYGDVVPISTGGRLFAGLVGLVGVGMLALPAGILASGFSSAVHQREQTYNRALELAYADGFLSTHERAELDKLRESLGITEAEAQNLVLELMQKNRTRLDCPHCGKTIHKR